MMDGTIFDRPELSAADRAHFRIPDPARLIGPSSSHAPRILLLHGSLRARSYSRFLAAERQLIAMGCETRRFDPTAFYRTA